MIPKIQRCSKHYLHNYISFFELLFNSKETSIHHSVPDGLGDEFKNIGENISWIIKSMKRIAEPHLFNFTEEFYEFLEHLSDRIKYRVHDIGVRIRD